MSGVLKINNSYVNDIISSQILSTDFLKEEVILAGGFPLSVYRAFEFQKPEYLDILVKQISSKRPGNNGLVYSDIDVWPTISLGNCAIAELFSNSSRLNSNIIAGDYVFNIFKQSRWANTAFLYSLNKKDNTPAKQGNNRFALQFIKNAFNSPEELISSFDLNICKVAYYNESLYVDESAINDIASNSLSMSPNYVRSDKEFNSKLFFCIRYIKYAKRYNLDMSKEICEYIFNTYFESSDKNILDEYISSDPNKINIVSLQKYEDKKTNSTKLYNSIVNDNTYLWFSKQNNFNPDWNLFLLDHPRLPIVKKLIDGSDSRIPF